MTQGRACVKCGADDWSARTDGTFCCRPCRVRRRASWYRRNADRVKAKASAYFYANHEKALERLRELRRENPEKYKAMKRDAYRRNPDYMKERSRKWLKENKERARVRSNEWRRRHPENRIAEVHKRRAARLAAPGRGVTWKERRDLIVAGLGVCAYCNERRRLTMDHIEPITKGGAHDTENIVAVCQSCNSSKSNHQLLPWLAKRMQGRQAA